MRENGNTVCRSKNPTIDFFSLKILSLLVCRDPVKVKMTLFLETVIGPEARPLSDQDMIDMSSGRLRRAIKLLLYFSEVFAKKYWSYFEKDIKDAK